MPTMFLFGGTGCGYPSINIHPNTAWRPSCKTPGLALLIRPTIITTACGRKSEGDRCRAVVFSADPTADLESAPPRDERVPEAPRGRIIALH
jgi:hypothetical protein